MTQVKEGTAETTVNAVQFNPINEQEAWVGIIYACANADEYISNTEIDKFTRALSYKTMFEDVDMVEMFERINIAAPDLGNMSLIERCAPHVSRRMRPTLFALAVELVVADGILHGEEEKTIYFLRDVLELDQELAAKIIEVMYIRFRGNVQVSHEEDELDDIEDD